MSIDRTIPPHAAEALKGSSSRAYAAYLYQRGYTCTSISKTLGVSRQAVAAMSKARPNQPLPPGFESVPKVRRVKRDRQVPPIPTELRDRMLSAWLLSTRYRHQHGPDTPWGKARQEFLDEVLVLQSHGYLLADIARDLGIPLDTLYRRIQRAREAA